MLRLIAVVAALAGTASASTVMRFEPAELEAEADRVVEGRVVAKTTAWNATRTGFETTVRIAVDRARKGGAAASVTVVVPGGELDGARHVIVGMPSVEVGEEARWFLRARGDGTYRVFGWAQGKWPATTTRGVKRFAPSPVAAEHPRGRFATNGMVWPAAEIPVEYLIQNAGSDDLSLADEIAAIEGAFATWQAVPTASLAFRNAGMTDLGLAIDDINVMLFVESGWVFGSEAAAATSLFIIDGMQTADIAVNGDNWRWAIGPSNAQVTSRVLDLQAVMTHEIGHFSGLGHTLRSHDTMYFSWKPWEGQRTLSIDDKLGLSSIYPSQGLECLGPSCPAGEVCTVYPMGNLCEGTPDPIGTACSYDRIECSDFCLFTVADLSAGYCSRFCESDADCPLTHHCDEASAGEMTVKVCFVGPQPPPVAECTTDGECPAGQHCADETCTFECRAADDCGPAATCDPRGFCIAAPPEEGGCSSSSPGALALLGLLALARPRRRSPDRHAS